MFGFPINRGNSSAAPLSQPKRFVHTLLIDFYGGELKAMKRSTSGVITAACSAAFLILPAFGCAGSSEQAFVQTVLPSVKMDSPNRPTATARIRQRASTARVTRRTPQGPRPVDVSVAVATGAGANAGERANGPVNGYVATRSSGRLPIWQPRSNSKNTLFTFSTRSNWVDARSRRRPHRGNDHQALEYCSQHRESYSRQR